jgi:ATP-dependent Lon protease
LTPDTLDIKHAAKILDRDHFGLAKVKDRILDYLAVRQVSQSLRGPILCFVGPPGVGKTSLGRSIAEATGRKFVQISLGGVRDEAEIRGHRRTYIGSLPGRLIQSLKTCGTSNPVCLLDEVDKMSRDLRGDPTSALLEALDPEQNNAFVDHYVEVPFDLSGVMFILTANVIENIPPALRDRMEIIDFSSYTEDEKMHIARTYLIPKKREEHGLRPDQFSVQEDALTQLIRGYTRESGVRNLEREIATLCRKATRRIAEQVDASVTIGQKELLAFLGRQKFHHDKAEEKDQVGAATGLVYTEFGGDIVTIEANLMTRKGPTSELTLTGCLGQVMKESAQAATTYVRSQEEKLAPGQPFDFDVHIHVPEGAVPKDGPSAGVTMVTALASAYTGRAVRRDVAMTGEVTLRGVVLPVGGLREKVLAAHRAGIKEVIVPQQNRPDLDDVPAGVLAELKLHFVQSVEEVIDIALTK